MRDTGIFTVTCEHAFATRKPTILCNADMGESRSWCKQRGIRRVNMKTSPGTVYSWIQFNRYVVYFYIFLRRYITYKKDNDIDDLTLQIRFYDRFLQCSHCMQFFNQWHYNIRVWLVLNITGIVITVNSSLKRLTLLKQFKFDLQTDGTTNWKCLHNAPLQHQPQKSSFR